MRANDARRARRYTDGMAGLSEAQRRRVEVAAWVGAASSLALALYQAGPLKRLPDLPGRVWDAEHIVLSPRAFVFGIPDAPIAVVGYAAQAALARASSAPGARGRWARRGLAASAVAGAAVSLVALWAMVTKERALCPYCLVNQAASFEVLRGSLPLLRSSAAGPSAA